jgi:thermitase
MFSIESILQQRGRTVASLMLFVMAASASLSLTARAALPSLAGPETYPRSTQTIEVHRGADIIRVRPLKTVRTLSKREAVADRLIVVYQSTASQADKDASHLRAGARGAGLAKPLLAVGPKAVLVDVTGAASLEAAARAYVADPSVRYASPDWIMHASETPNDPFIGSQGALNTIQAPAAWNRTHGSVGVLIAVLDSGINEAHPDLAGKVVARHDFTGSSSGTDDLFGHGTHVSGIAAASTNNAIGIAGVGYDSRLLNGKVLDDTGSGSVSMLFDGIYWATDNGAHVINMSLAGDDDCSTSWWEDLFDTGRNELKDSIGYAWERNVVLVAAAGNDGANKQHWPGACPNVLAIANTTIGDVKSSSSNFGTWVALAAPGSSIFSTAVPGASACQSGLTGQFANCSGTSMATPHVSGLAALVRASCGFSSGADIVARLTSTADAIPGTGSDWQFGRINALRAVCFPAPASLRIGNVTATSIQILWTDMTPGETRFEINEQPVGGSATTVIVPANTTSFTHSGLTAGANIDYRVRACDGLGCSDWSMVAHGRTGAKLSVSVLGGGKVASSPAGITCGNGGTDCTEVYNPGTSVKLTATPYINLLKHIAFEFDHWEGACSGQDFICTVSMTGAKSAKAVFVKDPTGGL